MNATELFKQTGETAGVYYCGNCRRVAPSQFLAERCCLPNICECGKVCEQHYVKCSACIAVEHGRKESTRFEKATKLTEWDGWVYRDGYGNEGFCESIGELVDACEDEEEPLPDYVWTCKPKHFVNINVDHVLENATQDGYEDFEYADLVGVDELKTAINAFNAANFHSVSYEPDYSAALVLKPLASLALADAGMGEAGEAGESGEAR